MKFKTVGVYSNKKTLLKPVPSGLKPTQTFLSIKFCSVFLGCSVVLFVAVFFLLLFLTGFTRCNAKL